ncbi:MAG: hypothetical protein K0A93_02980 [Desulfuromonadaceae bacterium]|nr:hypothetical protein [Desulfuromonadaceae bacterium]
MEEILNRYQQLLETVDSWFARSQARAADPAVVPPGVKSPVLYGLTPCMRLRTANVSPTTIRPFFGKVVSIRHKTLDFGNPSM